MAKYRILSIDGGGLRGLIPVMILKDIEKITGKRIYELFDLIAGTSTGGLIACAILLGDKGKPKYDLETIEKIFTEKGPLIFNNPKRKFGNWLFRSKYNPTALQNELNLKFNDLDKTPGNNARLSNLLKPVIIPAYDVKRNKPVVFKSRYSTDSKRNRNPTLYDVCLATSAAPTYFPGHKLFYDDDHLLCIDGGVFMNNPALDALVEFINPDKNSYYGVDNEEKNDFFLLSIGTGEYKGKLVSDEIAVNKGGLLNWGELIPNVMLYSGSQTTHYKTHITSNHINKISEMNQSSNYLRINIEILDENHKEIDDFTTDTRKHLIDLFNEQYLYNSAVQNNLLKFFEDSQ